MNWSIARFALICTIALGAKVYGQAATATPGVGAAASPAAPAPAQPQPPVSVTIGDSTVVTLPVPAGFVDVQKAPLEIRENFTTMVPPTNRYLAGFVLPENAVRPADDNFKPLERYMIVQTFRQAENVQVSPADFKDVKDQIAGSMDKILAEKKDEINERLKKLAEQGQTEQVELAEPMMLGTFLQQDDAISSAMVMKVRAPAGQGGVSERVIACGMSIIRVKQKIVYLYVYGHYTDEAALTWVKDTSKKWVADTLAANP